MPDVPDYTEHTNTSPREDIMDEIRDLIAFDSECPRGTHVWDNITPSACWKCGIPKEANK